MSDEGPEFEIKESDIGRLRAALRGKIAPLPIRMARGMTSVGEVWMTKSKKRVPVQYGNLRSSGHVVPAKKVGSAFEVRLVFGGPAADYAAAVHENLKAHHKNGQAKYLESVVLEEKSTFVQQVNAFAGEA